MPHNALDGSLNRTIMELKFVIVTSTDESREVLIVPLWN